MRTWHEYLEEKYSNVISFSNEEVLDISITDNPTETLNQMIWEKLDNMEYARKHGKLS